MPLSELDVGDVATCLIDTAQMIVLVLDPDAKIIMFNRYMEDLGGHPLAEVKGRDWFELFIPGDDREAIRSLFARAVAGEPVVGNVNPIVTRGGARRQIEWNASVLHDNDGGLVGVVCVGCDVSDKLEIQTRLLASERLAAIGMLASVFAHEVGNPLNAMYLQAQLLRRRIARPDPTQPLAPKVDLIMAEIRRLNALLEDFRGFHRPERVLLEPTDVNAVLSDVVETLEPRAEDTRVTLATELALELPRVDGNANKLKQVVLNLCKNAIEAMPEGGTLRLCSRCVEDRVEIEVVDNGHGIPDDFDVFEPFATTKPAGMGLGLALVREIVHAHAGEIIYRSSPTGTTFTVSLPARS